MGKIQLKIKSHPPLTKQKLTLTSPRLLIILRTGCLLLLLRTRSVLLEILGFLVRTNTGIFLRSLKLCGESRT